MNIVKLKKEKRLYLYLEFFLAMKQVHTLQKKSTEN